MKIHEYQAMILFKEYGISTVPCELAKDIDDAVCIAKDLGGKVVCKAQVLVGGRGNSGGIKKANSPDEAKQKMEEILSIKIKSVPVEKVLIAKQVDILKEYYVGITVDRGFKKVVLLLSASGGVDIEELAEKHPNEIHKIYITPPSMPIASELKELALKLFKDKVLADSACDTIARLYKLFIEKDASLAEINPFCLIRDGKLIAADAKIVFDDNSLFKHPEIAKLSSSEEYSDSEIEAREAGLSFVSMDGDIGCIVNGAGLAMATMDMIKLFGASPANFLDVGGSSNPSKVLNALKIILKNKRVKAVLINIFGGITRCDDIANGIITAQKEIDIKVPLIIRLIGTNEKKGRDILKAANFVVAESMTEAVKKAVEVVLTPEVMMGPVLKKRTSPI